MKDLPILFKGPMVRAILEDRKNLTRRIFPEQHHACLTGDCPHSKQSECDAALLEVSSYKIGQRRWVKETFRIWKDEDSLYKGRISNLHPDLIEWLKPRTEYAATSQTLEKGDGWRPSIFMPRWASRITLEVTGVRVERLQEISEEDAKAEGVELGKMQPAIINGESGSVMIFDPRKAFSVLWDSINKKKYPWSSNPWVAVITFKRV
jgi:hypothetical protein